VTTSVDEGVLKIVPQFQVTGNSPYLGSVTATLRNSSKEIIAEHDQTVALYFAGKRAIDLKIPENLPAGAYEIELLYETKRSDIPSSDLVKSPTITKTISMNIQ
jgi:acetyl-CoA carboxylase beta subunit